MTQNAKVLRVLSDIKKLPLTEKGREVLRDISITGAVKTQMISQEEGTSARGGKKEEKEEKETTETSDGTR